jgi:hypothetical protein
VEDIVMIVSLMTREKNADISLACLGTFFGKYPVSSRECYMFDTLLINHTNTKYNKVDIITFFNTTIVLMQNTDVTYQGAIIGQIGFGYKKLLDFFQTIFLGFLC